MGERIHRCHHAGSSCARDHIRDHCAHPDLPNADLRMVTVAPRAPAPQPFLQCKRPLPVPPYMGRLKSSANFMVLPFFVPFVLAIGGDRPTPIDPHESGGGGRSLDLKTTKRHEAEPASS